ncbi:glycosyltransferase EpsE [Methylococcales bacterium]|nr:glycosyltransferase EpsE [Methylococcales bacterium]
MITVLMPVYNGAADLRKAIDTILSQTYTQFEFLIINDGSKDESALLLDAIDDPRVKVVHQENMGLAATLNRGISLARGRYIARQDQDDLSHPNRLEKQLSYMEAHPECGLLGSRAEIWVGDQPTDRTHDHPTEHGILSFDLLFNNPFVHSSVMLRKETVLSLGGYSTDPLRQPPEDYELWSRMARHCKVANLPERLLIYREVPQSMSRSGPNPFLDRLVTISAENLAFANGLSEPDSDSVDVAALTHSAFHRLSSRPNIDRMTKTVLSAGDKLAKDCPPVMAMAEERARILRYQWALHRANAHWAKPILRYLRRAGRLLGLTAA